jgi:hypothetical protein
MMALKPDQKIIADDINFRVGEVEEKGIVVCYASTAEYVEKKTDPSGAKVAGLLMVDVRNRDVRDSLGVTAITRNYSKIEVPQSGVVRLVRIGMLRTNDVKDGDTFAQGNKLYIAGSGKLSNAQISSDHEEVGHALGAKDSDGYVRIWLNIS